MEQDVKNMLETQPDYIAIKRYKNSLAELETRYPDGAPNHIVALALDTTEEDVENRYLSIISCLKANMGLS